MFLVPSARMAIQQKTECAGTIHVTAYSKVQFVPTTTFLAMVVNFPLFLALRQSSQLLTGIELELLRCF
jgi:hypothetical protein